MECWRLRRREGLKKKGTKDSASKESTSGINLREIKLNS
jgi:hypothetical protein